jgi:hypothetical protein
MAKDPYKGLVEKVDGISSRDELPDLDTEARKVAWCKSFHASTP